MDFTVVIPARFGSSRFPGKPLANIVGKPMIRHVVDRATEAGAKHIIVATDDQRIADTVHGYADVCMTAGYHESGTERLSEVTQILGIDDNEIVVNVQGDEPFVPADNIHQVAENLAQHKNVVMSTLATPLDNADDINNPNCVKVVVNQYNHALYFSRSAIPFYRQQVIEEQAAADPDLYLRHIGLYAYRAAYIRQYVSYSRSKLEQLESLEQLRALWYGDNIHVDIAKVTPPGGIDTPADLERLVALLKNKGGEFA